MAMIDRIAALVSGLQLTVSASDETGNLWVSRNLSCLRFCGAGLGPMSQDGVYVTVSEAGADTPLSWALPDPISINLNDAPDLCAMLTVLLHELDARRCGGSYAIDRLCEVIIVQLLRHQLENGDLDLGPLAGLAHAKLAPAMVAMHNAPGRGWRVDDLAQVAGMSRSRFMDEFQQTVGQSPVSYLRGWRMAKAKSALQAGSRVGTVARNYGYTSGEAFTRAFARTYGHPPSDLT